MEQATPNAVAAPKGKEIRCLDKGFVRLVDVMGDDSSIVQAARVSYGSGTKRLSEDRGLIRYLMRHQHTTPFEMVEFKFHIKLPIFVARQWIRHRTANVNEYSGRYSIMKEEFYLPEEEQIRAQSRLNKQGRTESPLPPETRARIVRQLDERQKQSYADYEAMLGDELARELARINLPLSMYTEWYWKIDLHNLFHFLRLRLDDHAQYEIRVYGEALADLVKDIVPVAWEAFEDYSLKAVRLTRLELLALQKIVSTHQDELHDDEKLKSVGLSKREIREFKAKIQNVLDAQ